MLTTDQVKALLAEHHDVGDEPLRQIAYALGGRDAAGAFVRDPEPNTAGMRASVLTQRQLPARCRVAVACDV